MGLSQAYPLKSSLSTSTYIDVWHEPGLRRVLDALGEAVHVPARARLGEFEQCHDCGEAAIEFGRALLMRIPIGRLRPNGFSNDAPILRHFPDRGRTNYQKATAVNRQKSRFPRRRQWERHHEEHEKYARYQCCDLCEIDIERQ